MIAAALATALATSSNRESSKGRLAFTNGGRARTAQEAKRSDCLRARLARTAAATRHSLGHQPNVKVTGDRQARPQGAYVVGRPSRPFC